MNSHTMFVLAAALVLAGELLPSRAGAGEFDCIIEPRQVVDLRPAMEGVIERIEVDRGDSIRKGQTLVVLQSGVELANVDLAKHRASMLGGVRSREARMQFAALRSERAQTLVQQKFISAQDKDEALAEKNMSEADLLEAQDNQRLAEFEYRRAVEQLNLRTIRAPFSGTVMDRLMNPGDVTDMSDSRKPVLRIAEISTLYVEVILPAQAYGLLQLGAKAKVVPDVGAKGEFTAVVGAIDKVMDAASGTFGVRLELRNEDYQLPAGIRCRAQFREIPNELSRQHPLVHSTESLRRALPLATATREP